MSFEVGDLVLWNGLRAQVDEIYQETRVARLLLFPQPGVSINTRYQNAPLTALVPYRKEPAGAGLRELIGHRCRCVFNLPSSDWPFEGYPAWVYVDDVDLPLIKLRSYGDPRWVSAATIQTIEITDAYQGEKS